MCVCVVCGGVGDHCDKLFLLVVWLDRGPYSCTVYTLAVNPW